MVDEMRPPNPIEVPLWLALFYKKRDKCRIIPPDWLEPGARTRPGMPLLAASAAHRLPLPWTDALERVLGEEKGNQNAFAELPFHYVEVSKELLETAADDLPDVHKIRSLLLDIEDARRQKVERGLRNFDHNTTSVKLKNLAAMELNRIRTVATKALDDMRAFDAQPLGSAQEDDEPSQRPSQSTGGSGNAQLQAALRRRDERR
tara:strand:+ start:200 stop:811 length:612 start_codon:yes stop_codon:yes gene_type:complete